MKNCQLEIDSFATACFPEVIPSPLLAPALSFVLAPMEVLTLSFASYSLLIQYAATAGTN